MGYQLWDSQKIQVCRCDLGYDGPDCSHRISPRGDDPLTSIKMNMQKQTVMIGPSTGTPTYANEQFIMIYHDPYGGIWRTDAIDATSDDNILGSRVQDALRALPNEVLEGVKVTAAASTTVCSTSPASRPPTLATTRMPSTPPTTASSLPPACWVPPLLTWTSRLNSRTSLARPVFSTSSKSTRPPAPLVPSPSPLASPRPRLRSPSPRSTTTRTSATSPSSPSAPTVASMTAKASANASRATAASPAKSSKLSSRQMCFFVTSLCC